jgi:succinylglutamate desuccinylase
MRRVGGWGMTLECGQHDDPLAPEVAYQAIVRTLAHLGLIATPNPPVAPQIEALRLSHVIDKDDAEDRFSRAWASFDPLHAGDLIATRHDGTALRAEFDGRIVFPNPGAEPGQEWFYVARPSQRVAA